MLVICPLLQQLQPQSGVVKLSSVYLTEMAVQCAKIPPKRSDVWPYYRPVASEKNDDTKWKEATVLSDQTLSEFLICLSDDVLFWKD